MRTQPAGGGPAVLVNNYFWTEEMVHPMLTKTTTGPENNEKSKNSPKTVSVCDEIPFTPLLHWYIIINVWFYLQNVNFISEHLILLNLHFNIAF